MSLRVAPQRHEAVSHETVDSYRWISCLGGDCFVAAWFRRLRLNQHGSSQ